jgi:hypothetical protein
MSQIHRTSTERLQVALIGFVALMALSLVAVYLADPGI